MKWTLFAAAVIGVAFLISCGEDDPDPEPMIDHQKIIDEVNAHLDAIGGVSNIGSTTAMVVTFDFKTADTAENRALLKVLAPNAPSDGRLILRIQQTLEQVAAGEPGLLEVGNMKLEVASETSVTMSVEFIGTVTIDLNQIPIGVNTENSSSDTFMIKYPLMEGGLEIDGVMYTAIPVEESS